MDVGFVRSLGLGAVSLRSLDDVQRSVGLVARSGLRISVLPSDLGAGLCFLLWIWRWFRIWIRGLDWLASAWTMLPFPSLVGRVWRTLRRCRFWSIQPRRLCSPARGHAIFEREPGDACCELP